MIKYYKLNKLLKDRGINWKEIRIMLNMSSGTVAKINKNQMVSLEVIDRLCDYLEVQPGDIMEFVAEKPSKEILKEYQDFLLNPNISPQEKIAKSLKFGLRYGDTYAKELMYNKKIDKAEEQ